MGKDVLIRQLSIADSDLVESIMIPGEHNILDFLDYEEDLCGAAWGIFVDNHLIGFCTFGCADVLKQEDKNMPWLDYSWILSNVYIIPELRNQGYGKMLVQNAIKGKFQCENLITAIYADIPYSYLRYFYRQSGFIPTQDDEYLLERHGRYIAVPWDGQKFEDLKKILENPRVNVSKRETSYLITFYDWKQYFSDGKIAAKVGITFDAEIGAYKFSIEKPEGNQYVYFTPFVNLAEKFEEIVEMVLELDEKVEVSKPGKSNDQKECAYCHHEITGSYLKIGDNFLQAKYFDDEETENIFCSPECLCRGLSVLEIDKDGDSFPF